MTVDSTHITEHHKPSAHDPTATLHQYHLIFYIQKHINSTMPKCGVVMLQIFS